MSIPAHPFTQKNLVGSRSLIRQSWEAEESGESSALGTDAGGGTNREPALWVDLGELSWAMGGGARRAARMCVGNFSWAPDPRPGPPAGHAWLGAGPRSAQGSVVCAEVGHASARARAARDCGSQGAERAARPAGRAR